MRPVRPGGRRCCGRPLASEPHLPSFVVMMALYEGGSARVDGGSAFLRLGCRPRSLARPLCKGCASPTAVCWYGIRAIPPPMKPGSERGAMVRKRACDSQQQLPVKRPIGAANCEEYFLKEATQAPPNSPRETRWRRRHRHDLNHQLLRPLFWLHITRGSRPLFMRASCHGLWMGAVSHSAGTVCAQRQLLR